MSDTTTRALSLLNLLQTHRHWPGSELADRLGVTERTAVSYTHLTLPTILLV